MFQFRRFPSYAYLIQRRMTGYCPAGLPHSEIPGSMDICSSPRLIAACHVLLRLLMPRHSPCALSSLTYRRFHSDLSENSWFSLRIMQAYKDRNCMSPCILSDAVPQSICFVMCFHTTPLCCLTCFCHIVQFSRCRLPTTFAVRFEDPTFYSQVFKSKGKSPGGPEWARTTDLTIISRTL